MKKMFLIKMNLITLDNKKGSINWKTNDEKLMKMKVKKSYDKMLWYKVKEKTNEIFKDVEIWKIKYK